MSITYAHTEMGLRDALRTRPLLLAFLLGDPHKIDLDYDAASKIFINLYRSGGFPSKWISTDNGLFSAHCYGKSRRQAMDLSLLLVNELQMWGGCYPNCDVWFYGAEVQSLIYLPDPSDGHERYICNFLARSRPATATEITNAIAP